MSLNFSALSFDSPFDRDTVESCIREVVNAVARSLNNKRNVEFTFAGIGRLQIRDTKVKMIFYKDFLNSVDGSGKLVEALKDVSWFHKMVFKVSPLLWISTQDVLWRLYI